MSELEALPEMEILPQNKFEPSTNVRVLRAVLCRLIVMNRLVTLDLMSAARIPPTAPPFLPPPVSSFLVHRFPLSHPQSPTFPLPPPLNARQQNPPLCMPRYSSMCRLISGNRHIPLPLIDIYSLPAPSPHLIPYPLPQCIASHLLLPSLLSNAKLSRFVRR